VERSGGYTEVSTRIGGDHLHTDDLRKGLSHRFELQLPRDALPAYRSGRGSLRWEVEVRLDRKLPQDSDRPIPIDVLPDAA
jgi:hypothetical protein